MNNRNVKNIEENTYTVYQRYIKENLLRLMEKVLEKYLQVFKDDIYAYNPLFIQSVSFAFNKKQQTLEIKNSDNEIWNNVSGREFYSYIDEFISKNQLGYCLYYAFDPNMECCQAVFNTSLGGLYKAYEVEVESFERCNKDKIHSLKI